MGGPIFAFGNVMTELLLNFGWGAFGLLWLVLGGDWLVKGAAAIARFAGLTPAVIGLTIVAAGTSFPELVVSVISAIEGRPDLAVGNAVGSNISNTTLILGLTALLVPLPVRGNVVRLEWPVMALASLFCWAFMQDATIDRVEGVAFLAALVAFLAYSVRIARRELTETETSEYSESLATQEDTTRYAGWFKALGLIGLGIVGLIVGGQFIVQAAVELARLGGLSERVIGLTIVAVGTSAPEVATSIVAARRGQTDVAIANIIGSNIFNILGILGVTALIHPITFDPALAGTDMGWLVGTSLLLFPMLRTGMTLVRREGALLLTTYVVYVALLLKG